MRGVTLDTGEGSPLRRRFAVAVVLMVVPLLVAGGIGALSLRRAAERSQEITRDVQRQAAAVDGVQRQLLSAARVAPAAGERAQEFGLAAARVEAAFEELEGLSNAEERGWAHRARRNWRDARVVAADALDARPGSSPPQAFYDQLALAHDNLDAHASVSFEEQQRQLAAFSRVERDAVLGLLAALALAGALAAVSVRRLSGSIARPLRSLDDAMNRLGAGDLSTRVEVEHEDELGSLANRFNAAASRLERSRDELVRDALDDALTGLPNRTLLGDCLQHAVARARAKGGTLAFLVVDLDDFARVNESLGRTSGDAQLEVVGGRVAACVRRSDTAARLGGDQFAVLLEDVDDAGDAVHTAGRILQAVSEPLTLGDKEVLGSASVGIALSVAGEHDADQVLRNAELAMRTAKASGKGRYELYMAAMHERAVERLHLEGDLRGAVERGEFELYYQPIVDVRSRSITGLEALLRWRHADGRLVLPSEFIPAAEQAGLMEGLDRFALFRACREGRSLQERHDRLGDVAISINLSARQFEQPRLVEHVAESLAESALDPAHLVLEVTERVMMRDPEAAAARVHELNTLGVRIALDDFGTGYSSLAYLRRLPIDILKIDKTFVAGGAGGDGDPQLARLIVQLASTLRLRAIAEGIERPSQLRAVRAIGCPLAQGYLFGRPAPAAEVHRVFRQVDDALADGVDRQAVAIRGAASL